MVDGVEVDLAQHVHLGRVLLLAVEGENLVFGNGGLWLFRCGLAFWLGRLLNDRLHLRLLGHLGLLLLGFRLFDLGGLDDLGGLLGRFFHHRSGLCFRRLGFLLLGLRSHCCGLGCGLLFRGYGRSLGGFLFHRLGGGSSRTLVERVEVDFPKRFELGPVLLEQGLGTVALGLGPLLLLWLFGEYLLGLCAHFLVALELLFQRLVMVVVELEVLVDLRVTKVEFLREELHCRLESYVQFFNCFA